MMSLITACLLLALSAHSALFARAEPVQYCRYGHATGEVDFCMGLTNHYNRTTDAYDMYLSLTTTQSSAAGWTAIGTGAVMDESLMFIVYGDPVSGDAPTLSIRTVRGHQQPQPIATQAHGSTDIRILQSMWINNQNLLNTHDINSLRNEPVRSKFAVVCYSCSRWPGASISGTSSSQAWIWAWNEKQHLSDYGLDARLQMHKHHAGMGGWGTFYVDMARATTQASAYPSFPPIRPGVTTLGTSELPISMSGVVETMVAKPLASLHGFFMATAFLLLFPLGVIAIRSKSGKTYRNHWMLQVLASGFVLAGSATGIVMSNGSIWSFAHPHQCIGIVVTVLLVLQSYLGWRHHVIYLKIRSRTWISHAHIWLGRLMLISGWTNVLLGMRLSGFQRLGLGLVTGLVSLEAMGLAIQLWAANQRRKLQARNDSSSDETNHTTQMSRIQDDAKYFAIDGGDDDSDTDSDTVVANSPSIEKE